MANKSKCPGCESSVAPGMAKHVFEDAADRMWHPKCAGRSLADFFRTPLSEADATKAVEFAHAGDRLTSAFTAPHSFHLREIVLAPDAEVSALYVGATTMLVTFGATVRARDLPERRLVVDADVPIGVGVTVSGHGEDLGPLHCRLVGERLPEKSRMRPPSGPILAVAPLRTIGDVPPGAVAEVQFSMPGRFRAERLACDDFREWEVVDVRVGVDPGRHPLGTDDQSRAVGVGTALVGPLTGSLAILPVFTALVGERVCYHMRNTGRTPRAVAARVYGTLTF